MLSGCVLQEMLSCSLTWTLSTIKYFLGKKKSETVGLWSLQIQRCKRRFGGILRGLSFAYIDVTTVERQH